MRTFMTIILLFFSNIIFSQKVGYEIRTNGNSYITFSHKIHDNGGLELRHKTNLGENRFTYRHNLNFGETPVVFSVPLHYKVEKDQPTLEPRLIYKFESFKLWVQQEFWFDEIYNLAIAVDIPYNNNKFIYRIGWDNSKTIRFRFSIKI